MAKQKEIPFDPIDYLTFQFLKTPNPVRDEIRMEFRKVMIELYQAEEKSFRSMKIPELLNGLGKTCTKLKDKWPKSAVRISLADYYLMAGVHVRASGEIVWNYH